MKTRHRLRHNLSLAALLVAGVVVGQPREQTCFFSAAFDTPDQLNDWDLGPQVERRSPTGTPLGEFVTAWNVGNAQEANAAGYFPVPDQPIGNRFVMANDAAPPCNCDFALATLTTPVLDLSGKNGVAMECRVYNEGTFGAGPALVQVSIADDQWITMATIPTVVDEWQDLFINLSAFDGQSAVRIRFLWSDAGAWASGFALDDLCLRERFANDASIVRVLAHDVAISPFTMGDQTLRYRQLPLEQAGPLTVSVEVKNSGTDILRDVVVSTSLFQNGANFGPFDAPLIDSLVPGERMMVRIATGWQADAVGELDVFATIGASGMDEDVNDNSGLAIVYITGPGWDNGYAAMACDEGEVQGGVGGSQGFIAANRMEIIEPGSVAQGISVQFGTGTYVGAVVRAILTDGSLALIDTSSRKVLAASDLELIYANAPLYFPMTATPELFAGDLFVGIQHLAGASGNVLEVGVSGDAPIGASILREGTTFTLSYLRSTPMVRLHLAAVEVGVEESEGSSNGPLHLYPIPANTMVHVDLEQLQNETLEGALLDAMGRNVRSWSFGAAPLGKRSIQLPLEDLAEGAYHLVLTSGSSRWQGRLLIVH